MTVGNTRLLADQFHLESDVVQTTLSRAVVPLESVKSQMHRFQAQTRHLNMTAASSAGRLRRDNVTLTFDLSTQKPNQFIFVPRCTNDKSLEKIHQ